MWDLENQYDENTDCSCCWVAGKGCSNEMSCCAALKLKPFSHSKQFDASVKMRVHMHITASYQVWR